MGTVRGGRLTGRSIDDSALRFFGKIWKLTVRKKCDPLVSVNVA